MHPVARPGIAPDPSGCGEVVSTPSASSRCWSSSSATARCSSASRAWTTSRSGSSRSTSSAAPPCRCSCCWRASTSGRAWRATGRRAPRARTRGTSPILYAAACLFYWITDLAKLARSRGLGAGFAAFIERQAADPIGLLMHGPAAAPLVPRRADGRGPGGRRRAAAHARPVVRPRHRRALRDRAGGRAVRPGPGSGQPQLVGAAPAAGALVLRHRAGLRPRSRRPLAALDGVRADRGRPGRARARGAGDRRDVRDVALRPGDADRHRAVRHRRRRCWR